MSTIPPTQDQTIPIPITWNELLQTPDRQLRRLLANRYRQATHTGRTLDTFITELATKGIRAEARRHQVNSMLDAECARIEATAQARYTQMAHDYTTRIQAGERATPTTHTLRAAA